MESTHLLTTGGALLVVLLLARRARRIRRLRQAAASPAPGAPRLPVAELKQKLVALASPDSPFQCFQENGEGAEGPTGPPGRIIVTWQLLGIPWATLLFRRKLRETQALELLPGDDGRVLVRVRGGTIEWETAAATWMPKAKVAWRYPRSFDPGPPPSAADPPPTPTAESPRDLATLVRHIRPIVVAAGWAFVPVLDFAT